MQIDSHRGLSDLKKFLKKKNNQALLISQEIPISLRRKETTCSG